MNSILMLKFFVADQCTKRHNKNFQSTCLDVFDKNWHVLPPIPSLLTTSLLSSLGNSSILFLIRLDSLYLIWRRRNYKWKYLRQIMLQYTTFASSLDFLNSMKYITSFSKLICWLSIWDEGTYIYQKLQDKNKVPHVLVINRVTK